MFFRNYAAYSEYSRPMPDDTAAEIFHPSELINQIWSGVPTISQVRREIVALAWTDTAITHGLARGVLSECGLCRVLGLLSETAGFGVPVTVQTAARHSARICDDWRPCADLACECYSIRAPYERRMPQWTDVVAALPVRAAL